jgi:hypothetical protein
MLCHAAVAQHIRVEPMANLALWFIISITPAVLHGALILDNGVGVLAHITSYVLSV